MKTKNIMKTTFAMAAVLALGAAGVSALPEAQVTALKKSFKNVPATEMAAKAAQIVSSVSAKEQQEVAVEVIRVVVAKKPAVAASAAAAIAAVAPDTAPAVAAAAAAASKSNAEKIALATAQAAPAQSAMVFESVAQAAPNVAVKMAEYQAATTSTSSDAASIAAAGTITVRPGFINGRPVGMGQPSLIPTAIPGFDSTRPVVPPYSAP